MAIQRTKKLSKQNFRAVKLHTYFVQLTKTPDYNDGYSKNKHPLVLFKDFRAPSENRSEENFPEDLLYKIHV